MLIFILLVPLLSFSHALFVFSLRKTFTSVYLRRAFISNSVEQHCQPVAGWDKRGQISLWLAFGTWDKHASYL